MFRWCELAVAENNFETPLNDAIPSAGKRGENAMENVQPNSFPLLRTWHALVSPVLQGSPVALLKEDATLAFGGN